jgi:hypothetical protein
VNSLRRAIERLLGRPLPEVADGADGSESSRQKREAVAHASAAADRLKHRMESPNIRLIIQSADGLSGMVRDGGKDRR